MYNRKSKFKKIYDRFISENACDDPNLFFSPIISKNPNITFGEAMDKFLSSDDARDAWAIWAFKLIGDECDEQLRKEMLNKISDPMKALKMSEKFSNLSDKEKQILESKYKGKLPKAEKQLKEKLKYNGGK
jgi:hypothetical protein